MCINQYPNTLIVTVAGEAVRNGNGTYTAPAPATPINQVCRYEADAVGKEFNTADGNVVKSKGTVYMPADAPVIAVGTMVEIPGYVKAPVLHFYKGELHCTLRV